MKAWTSKAVPSPGRANKYPPPLMRFLKSTVGSRSRGRSSRHSSSVFTRRKRTTAIDAHQEPSSPKVTCIGQVRVRRSCKPKSGLKKKAPGKRKPADATAAGNRFCYWVGNPTALCFRPPWRKWVSFFRCGKFWARTNSSIKESNPTVHRDGGEEEEERKWSPRESRILPENALILARCRSAPHRSSYLASRLWGSPSKTEHENKESIEEDKETNFLENEQIRKMRASESEMNGKEMGTAEICEDVKEANSTRIAPRTPNPNSVEMEKIGVLRRSKSEPGRRSGDPLSTSFWLESSSASSIHSVDNRYKPCLF